METKNLDNFLNDLLKLQEGNSLLESIYFNIGPYRLREFLYENLPKDDAIKITSRLERYFDFDDSE